MEQVNTAGAEPEVSLLEDKSLQDMSTWYDQQIVLATKSRDLALIKSDIAKSRLEETLAMVKIAELTAGPLLSGQEETDKQDSGETGKVHPLRSECSRSE